MNCRTRTACRALQLLIKVFINFLSRNLDKIRAISASRMKLKFKLTRDTIDTYARPRRAVTWPRQLHGGRSVRLAYKFGPGVPRFADKKCIVPAMFEYYVTIVLITVPRRECM